MVAEGSRRSSVSDVRDPLWKSRLRVQMHEHGPVNAWEEIAEIFAGAIEQPVADRDAWLQNACGGRAELLGEVAAMLRADDSGSRLALEDQLLSDGDPT